MNESSAASKRDVLQQIRANGIIAVIRVDSAEAAVNVARAIVAGGIRIVEITYTIPDAGNVIARLVDERARGELDAQLLLGAGTVLAATQAHEAVDAGARFLVSPCVVPAVMSAARERGVVMLPGAFTPTEIHSASIGGDIVKVFPASHFGPQYFRDLSGPFPHIPLLPSAGVNIANVGEWFRAGAVAVGIGSSVIDPAAVARGDWPALTERAREFVEAVRRAREDN